MPWTNIIEDLTVKEIVGAFYDEKLQNTNQTELRIESDIEKCINYMLSGKAIRICLIAGLIKRISIYKISYYPGLIVTVRKI